jgi:hypothetical protein
MEMEHVRLPFYGLGQSILNQLFRQRLFMGHTVVHAFIRSWSHLLQDGLNRRFRLLEKLDWVEALLKEFDLVLLVFHNHLENNGFESFW